MRNISLALILFFIMLGYLQLAYAQRVLYVTDKIEITLRTGPSIENKILRMLPSGTKLYPLGDIQDGWIKVRTESGIEGWVLEKYTVLDPPAFLKLKECLKKAEELSRVQKENLSLKDRLDNFKKEYEELKAKYVSLKNDAANIDTIKNNFMVAKKELKVLKANVLRLQKENSELKSKRNLYWFIIGALTVIFSFLVGFIAGRVQRRRNRSLYF